MSEKTAEDIAIDKANYEKNMAKIMKVARSPSIGACHHHHVVSTWENNMMKLIPGFKPRPKIHQIKFLDKSLKCIVCGGQWCCDECAIECDAIPGFLNQWKSFKRSRSPENYNIRLITCLKCKAKAKNEKRNRVS